MTIEQNEIQRTPLFESHKSLGAKMVPFAGWEMPIEYKGIVKEHAAVRNTCGLFDVSHMGEIEIKGQGAFDFCQRISTNDVSKLKPGKVQYTCLLNHEGGIVDDCTLYAISEQAYLFVVNAAHKSKVMTWFREFAGKDVEIVDKSNDFGLLALQGKASETILAEIIQRDPSTIKYYEFLITEIFGHFALISRTGYTGEDGFEIYIAADGLVKLWDQLLEVGAPHGIEPVGLGARDVLRLEMGYLLSGTDMNEDSSPLSVGLSWVCKLSKGQFVGRKSLKEFKEKGISHRLRGFVVEDRGIARNDYEVWSEDGSEKIGKVSSGSYSPLLKKSIGLAMVPAALSFGDRVKVRIREGKFVTALLTKPPFVEGSVKK